MHPPPHERLIRNTILFGLIGFLLYSILCEPVLTVWNDAIPVARTDAEEPPVRDNIAGPHLLLLNRFEGVHRMLRGEIPWLRDSWQFDSPEHPAPLRPSAFALPISLVYGLLRFVAPAGAAWNFTVWMVLSLTLAASWRALGLLTRDPWVRISALTVFMLIPFRWDLLYAGNPAALAFFWPGLLILTLHRLRGAPTLRGGFLLGGYLLLFFLTSPALLLLFLPHIPLLLFWPCGTPERPPLRSFASLLPGLLLAGLLMLLALLPEAISNAERLSGIPLPAFTWSGLWTSRTPSSHFLGPPLFWLLVLLALVRLVRRSLAGDLPSRHGLAYAAVFLPAGLLLLAGLSSGRLPSITFALIPFWLTTLITLGYRPRVRNTALRTATRKLCHGSVTLWLLLMLGGTHQATLSRLNPENRIYDRVWNETVSDPARALALPLLDGDETENASAAYMALQHRLRLLNGFDLRRPASFGEESLSPFRSANQGYLSQKQIDALLARQVHHLLVHEDGFPREASPFPVAETLFQLRNHPRLAYLGSDRGVHGFRLLAEPRTAEETDRLFPAVFPNLSFDLAGLKPRGGSLIKEEGTDGGLFWRVEADANAQVELPPLFLSPISERFVWVRARGHGRVRVESHAGREAFPPRHFTVSSLPWQWIPVPLPQPEAPTELTLRLTPEQGSLDLDSVLLAGGLWPERWPSRGLEIPAAAFFHQGHSSYPGTTVRIPMESIAAGTVLRGPFLPFPAELPVRLELVFDSGDHPEGLRLGEFSVHIPATGQSRTVPVISGLPSVMMWTPETNLPAEIQFHYSRHGSIILHSLRIESIFPE